MEIDIGDHVYFKDEFIGPIIGIFADHFEVDISKCVGQNNIKIIQMSNLLSSDDSTVQLSKIYKISSKPNGKSTFMTSLSEYVDRKLEVVGNFYKFHFDLVLCKPTTKEYENIFFDYQTAHDFYKELV